MLIRRMSDSSSNGATKRARRASARVVVAGAAQISRGHEIATLVVEDLSLGGMRARGSLRPMQLAPGETVRVRLSGTGSDRFDIVSDARVVRIEDGHVAFEWLLVDPQVAEQILILVATRRG